MDNNKYQKGKIYKLVCESTGLIYIGSTIQSLNDRLNRHKSHYILHQKGKRKYKCHSYKVLENDNYKIELIKNYPCESKKELEREEGKYQQIITCCNKLVAGRTHTEYNREWRKNPENMNKEREWNKKSREKNRDKILERNRIYREKNRDKINEKAKQKITCECGSIIRKNDLAQHKRTKKHIKYIEQLN